MLLLAQLAYDREKRSEVLLGLKRWRRSSDLLF